MSLSIFEFDNYRKYLRAWIDQARKEKKSNLSQLAEVAQIHTTYLSQVLSGQKQLNLEQASLMADHIEMTQLERDYFFILIQIDRAGNQSLKKYLLEKKRELEKQKDNLSKRFENFKQLSNEDKSKFYSSWLFAAILVSTDINGGQTLDQIAGRFQLSRTETEEILNFLCQTGLAKFDGSLYKLGETHIHVPANSPFVFKHHTNWRVKSLGSMDRKDATNLFFTSPMSVSKKDFQLIRDKTTQFIQEIIKIAKDSKSEEVICIGIDYFKV